MDTQALQRRLTKLRKGLLGRYPFFGRLLMHLSFGFAPCGTAFTDMKRIVFDPDFANRLSDKELEFVLLHELLHCVLKHCIRLRGKRRYLANIACDIVVNSTIFGMNQQSPVTIDRCEVMHLTPKNTEGRDHTVEEVYDMLCATPPDKLKELYGDVQLDLHDLWDRIDAGHMEAVWDRHVLEAASAKGHVGVPVLLERQLHALERTPKTNWRQLLQDYIRHDRFDYVMECPDRRYSGDILLPSFQDNQSGAAAERLWFFVDTSGSVTDEALAAAYSEIAAALDQLDYLSGMISFFDSAVTQPQPFETLEEFLENKPVGGGGTSFIAVAEMVEKWSEENEPPCVVIVLTDGYARFPGAKVAEEIAWIWLIVDSDVNAPFGETVHLDL